MADSKNDSSNTGLNTGFLGRWSQRKQDTRDGKPVAEPEMPVKAVVINNVNANARDTATSAVVEEKPEIPLPTMADVHELTAESDFSPFVAKNVAPEVRNSAMRKLFTDPHYNVMDRLDIYIDDYSQPDPIPMAMMRQLTSAKFLNLFKAEEEAEAAAEKAALEANVQDTPIGDDANTVSMPSVAQSDSENLSSPNVSVPVPNLGLNNDHSDLRLQQNHAARPHKLGRSAE